MNEQLSPTPPAGQEPKKGMSKGCLIGLIVGGVIIVMVLIAGLVCYLKMDDLAKTGGVVVVNEIRAKIVANPAEGVDSVEVNRIADAFVERLDTSEVDLQEISLVFQNLQAIAQKEQFDSTDAETFMRALTGFYPDLEELRRSSDDVMRDWSDSTLLEDTTTSGF